MNIPERSIYHQLPLLLQACVCSGLILLSSCGQKTDSSTQQDVEAITAVSKARAEAFSRGNAQGIAVHFTEEAILMAPDQPAMKGQKAVAAYYQSIFDAYEPALKSYYDEVEVSGDLAYGRGFAEVTLTPKGGGAPLKSTAKYLNILRRQPDGSWKTTHDIWNGNEPSKTDNNQERAK